jgi:signal transduction histidine kinase
MRAPLEWWNVTLFGPVLLGIAGDLQGPLRQSRERILRERTAPAGWPAIVADELMPGRETGRRSAAEAERVRLAADLHAEILPSLNMVLAESAAGASPEVIADRLRELERDVRGIVAERRLVILEELGIVEALEWLAERAEDRGPVAVGLTVQQAPTDGRPPREVERAAFRVAQLALDNALLHAAPGEIAIQVQAEPRRLRLQVEDDGGGLAPGSQERAARENRHGLADMRLQADLVHAHLDVRSERPGGTVVLFDWTGP